VIGKEIVPAIVYSATFTPDVPHKAATQISRAHTTRAPDTGHLTHSGSHQQTCNNSPAISSCIATPTTHTTRTKRAPSKRTKKNIHPQPRNVRSKSLYTWPEISDFYKAENSAPRKAFPAYCTTRRKPINPEHYKTGRPGRSDLKTNTKTSSKTSNWPPHRSNTKGSSPELRRFSVFFSFSVTFSHSILTLHT
jgi:hypothetical protein